jgi:hypothetical protein
MGTSSKSENQVCCVGDKQQHKVFICLSISFKFNPVFRKKGNSLCFVKQQTLIDV